MCETKGWDKNQDFETAKFNQSYFEYHFDRSNGFLIDFDVDIVQKSTFPLNSFNTISVNIPLRTMRSIISGSKIRFYGSSLDIYIQCIEWKPVQYVMQSEFMFGINQLWCKLLCTKGDWSEGVRVDGRHLVESSKIDKIQAYVNISIAMINVRCFVARHVQGFGKCPCLW